jgi:deoxyribonuclease V
MMACTDVHYEQRRAVAACILFRDCHDDRPCLEITDRIIDPAAYEPGRFYRRELPALLSVIDRLPEASC